MMVGSGMVASYATGAGHSLTPFLKVAFAAAFVLGIALLVVGSVRLYRDREAPARERGKAIALLALGLAIVAAPAVVRYVALDGGMPRSTVVGEQAF